ncbi:MAG: prephenate dehydratase [Rhizobiaceae bacterium]
MPEISKRTGRMAFQGEPGANSDTAIRNIYPGMEPVPCTSFEDVFVSMESGKVDLAMIPIENTIAGRVADIHHLLPQSDAHIIGEYFLPIHFHLMTLPGVEVDDIETIYSHVHALGQCRNIIRQHGWNSVVGGDTAGSARFVSERGLKNAAALAPRLAAELYGLEILRENVEDASHNTTRFVVLSRQAEWTQAGGGPVMTSFLFQVRNLPAALYKAMGGFATNGVNMTKLESYQLGGSFSATQFFADVEGHPEDVPVSNAFEELKFFCKDFRILGVYPQAGAR